nr:immunoglobulin heavy chain junction region [Mus musculus]
CARRSHGDYFDYW